MLISLSPLFWSAKLRSQNLMSRYEGRSDVEKWIPCRWHHFAGKTHMKRTKLGCVKKLCVSEISTELKKKQSLNQAAVSKDWSRKQGSSNYIKFPDSTSLLIYFNTPSTSINEEYHGISWNIHPDPPIDCQTCKTCSNHLLIGGAWSFLSPRHAFLSRLTDLHVVLSNLQNPAKTMDLNHGVHTWVGLK